jgi:hypothetical protein
MTYDKHKLNLKQGHHDKLKINEQSRHQARHQAASITSS